MPWAETPGRNVGYEAWGGWPEIRKRHDGWRMGVDRAANAGVMQLGRGVVAGGGARLVSSPVGGLPPGMLPKDFSRARRWGYLDPWRDDDGVMDGFALSKAASLARLFRCRAPQY